MNKRISGLGIIMALVTSSLYGQHLNVATYNLRYANHGDSLNGNGWGTRCPVIASLIRFHNFDIFGTQEGLFHQLEDLKGKLPGYAYIGIGRDDGKNGGEHSAIFYKVKKFSLLKKGDFWLSTVTDRPNKGWDAVLPRICSWGEFRENKTGFVFFFFNLHLDHIGVLARAESAKLVLEKIRDLAGAAPVILTGDFNVDQTSEPYRLLNSSGLLKDSYDLSAFRYALNGTFNNFKSDGKTDSRIDHIFLSKPFRVSRYGILTDSYRSAVADTAATVSANSLKEGSLSEYTAREPSDHFPVMVEVAFK